MAYSIQQFTSTGTEDHAILSFPYLDKADIHLYGDSVESAFVWASDTRIDFPPFPAGTEVVVRRLTNRDRVRYLLQEGAPFTREVLDQIHTQALYLAQESIEGAWFDLYGDVDMHGFRIRNAGDPEFPQDYTTRSWVEAQILAAELGDGELSAQLIAIAFEAIRRSYAEAGFNLVAGGFEAGGTLSHPNDVLLQWSTGKAFSGPAGVVPAGTNPTIGGFVDMSGRLLRASAVGVDAGTSATVQVMTTRGSALFTKVAPPIRVGDIVVGDSVYRLTSANVESSASLADEHHDGGCGWPQLRTTEETELKNRKAPLQITDDDVATNRTVKAWRLAEGIMDAATAGSFMTGYENEPNSQVIGFTGFDKIGSYQARDSVALFSQVQGQATTCEGAFTYTATTVTGPDIQTQWDKIKVGMILDTNLGNTSTYKGAVVIGKVDPYTLQVSPWVNTAGTTVAPPTNGTVGKINQRTHLWGLNSNAIVNNGAVQGIGAEIGMMCLTPGSGTNSKVIYAVNLGGESPEFGVYAKGPFRKGYTAVSSEEYAFYSKGASTNGSHFRAESPTGELEYDYGPKGLKYEAVDYALASASGQLTTRPITLGVGDNLVMTMPSLKVGRRVAYRNFSVTPHTVNGVSLASGSYTEFLCDGTSWLRLFTILLN